jgi:hypothetical protein
MKVFAISHCSVSDMTILSEILAGYNRGTSLHFFNLIERALA